jgi:hypothetical protein
MLVLFIVILCTTAVSCLVSTIVNVMLEKKLPKCDDFGLEGTMAVFYAIHLSIALPMSIILINLVFFIASNSIQNFNGGEASVLALKIILISHFLGLLLFLYSCVRHAFIFKENYVSLQTINGNTTCDCDNDKETVEEETVDTHAYHNIILTNQVFQKYSLCLLGIVLCTILFDSMKII